MTPYYQSGGIVLYNCDCRDALPEIKGVDLLLTDPPYEMTFTGGGIGSRQKNFQQMHGHLDGGFDFDILAPYENWMAFCSKKTLIGLLTFAESRGNRWMLITWNKHNPLPLCAGNYLPDTEYIVHCFKNADSLHGTFAERSRYILHPLENNSEFGHPAVKPSPVISRLIHNGSAEGMLVCDPFAGSGTTLIVAKQLNRRAIGIEIEERYCEIAARRLENTNPLFSAPIEEQGKLFERANIGSILTDSIL